MRDSSHMFLIATLVATRWDLHFTELQFDWLIDWLIDDAMFVNLLFYLILGFCYSNLTRGTGGFELASTITLILQANRLTKCDSHPKLWIVKPSWLLTLIRLGFLRIVFSGVGSIWLLPCLYLKKNLSNINKTLYNC